jgi:hypothetical protein
MGYNTVAVLLNDFSREIENSGEFGKRLAFAMRSFPERGAGYVPAALVVSQDHSSGYQVVVAHSNSGWRVQDAAPGGHTELNWQALDVMKGALERHGYKVTKRRKPKDGVTP